MAPLPFLAFDDDAIGSDFELCVQRSFHLDLFAGSQRPFHHGRIGYENDRSAAAFGLHLETSAVVTGDIPVELHSDSIVVTISNLHARGDKNSLLLRARRVDRHA